MVVGSLLLILVAVAMLGLGLVQSSHAALVGSIAASLLAAIVLVVDARRAAAARTTVSNDAYDDDELPPERGEWVPAASHQSRGAGHRRDAGTVYRHDDAGAGYRDDADTGDRRDDAARPAAAGSSVDTLPAVDTLPEDDEPDRGASTDQDVDDGRGHVAVELDFDLSRDVADDDPPDEPLAQVVAPDEAARVARMSAPVLVIDGRPRYHQAGCVHLLGRESETLPVSEAVELGFTPCSLCEPDSALLADAQRG